MHTYCFPYRLLEKNLTKYQKLQHYIDFHVAFIAFPTSALMRPKWQCPCCLAWLHGEPTWRRRGLCRLCVRRERRYQAWSSSRYPHPRQNLFQAHIFTIFFLVSTKSSCNSKNLWRIPNSVSIVMTKAFGVDSNNASNSLMQVVGKLL